MLSRRNLIMLIASFCVFIIGLVVYSLVPKTQLLFSVAPHQVMVNFDGQNRQVTSGSKIGVKPGTYKITVSRDQFDSYNLSVTVASGKTSEVLVALDPQTDAAKELLNNKESQDIIQRFNGNKMDDYQQQLKKDFPIINILPIQQRLYYIYPCQSQKYPKDTTKLAICVDITADEVKPYVETYIQSKGYDLNNYEVIWNNQSTATPGD